MSLPREVAARLDALGPTVALDVTLRPGEGAGTAETVLADAGDHGVATQGLPRITLDRGADDGPSSLPAGADLTVLELLGEGGMGRVFLARQHSLARDVAVKTLREAPGGTSSTSARRAARQAIIHEAVITGQLEHPAIVPIHALGLDAEGQPTLVMKRIEGVAWRELVDDPEHEGWEGWAGTADDRLPGHLQILQQVCNAVHFAHSRGVIHRDLKPDNVLIGRFGDVYVADWGIATRTESGMHGALVGTIGYMAPEMVEGSPVSPRTDVYLLGAVLHEVLTGAPRHEASTITEALKRALASEASTYAPDVEELGAVANRACARDPDDRFASARQVRDALGDYERHRAARALLRRASDGLEALRALGQEDARDERKTQQRLAEVRLAIEESERQWPTNPQLAAVVDVFDTILEARAQRAAELAELARQRDPRRGERQRTGIFVAVGFFGVLSSVSLYLTPIEPTPLTMMGFALVLAATVAVGLLAFRRTLLATAFNREAASILLWTLAVLLLSRTANFFLPFDPAQALCRDAWLMAAVIGAVSLTLVRWTWPVALIMVVGGTLTLASPEPLLVFGNTVGFSSALLAVLAWRFGGSPTTEDEN